MESTDFHYSPTDFSRVCIKVSNLWIFENVFWTCPWIKPNQICSSQASSSTRRKALPVAFTFKQGMIFTIPSSHPHLIQSLWDVTYLTSSVSIFFFWSSTILLNNVILNDCTPPPPCVNCMEEVTVSKSCNLCWLSGALLFFHSWWGCLIRCMHSLYIVHKPLFKTFSIRLYIENIVFR